MKGKVEKWIEEQEKFIQLMDSVSSNSFKEIQHSKNSASATLVKLRQILDGNPELLSKAFEKKARIRKMTF